MYGDSYTIRVGMVRLDMARFLCRRHTEEQNAAFTAAMMVLLEQAPRRPWFMFWRARFEGHCRFMFIQFAREGFLPAVMEFGVHLRIDQDEIVRIHKLIYT